MKEKILSLGSIVSSFFASLCCIGIPLLSALGLSSVALSVAPVILPHTNAFRLLTVLILGVAHYIMAKNKNSSKATKVLLWISTLVSVGSILYSYFLER